METVEFGTIGRAQYNAIKELDDKEMLEAYKAIFAYIFDNVPFEELKFENKYVKILLMSWLPSFQKTAKKVDKRSETSVENGKKGGRPKNSENISQPVQQTCDPKAEREEKSYKLQQQFDADYEAAHSQEALAERARVLAKYSGDKKTEAQQQPEVVYQKFSSQLDDDTEEKKDLTLLEVEFSKLTENPYYPGQHISKQDALETLKCGFSDALKVGRRLELTDEETRNLYKEYVEEHCE